MSKPTFYCDGNHYLLATGESPQGMAGVVAVVWEGETPNKLTESVKTVADLQQLEKVESSAVPAEWWEAFVKAKLVKPRPAPKPKQPKQPQRPDQPKQPKREAPKLRVISSCEPGPFLVFLFWLLVLLFIWN